MPIDELWARLNALCHLITDNVDQPFKHSFHIDIFFRWSLKEIQIYKEGKSR